MDVTVIPLIFNMFSTKNGGGEGNEPISANAADPNSCCPYTKKYCVYPLRDDNRYNECFTYIPGGIGDGDAVIIVPFAIVLLTLIVNVVPVDPTVI